MINNAEPSYLLRAGQYCLTDCGSKLILENPEKKLQSRKAGQSYRQLSKDRKGNKFQRTNKTKNRSNYTGNFSRANKQTTK